MDFIVIVLFFIRNPAENNPSSGGRVVTQNTEELRAEL